MRRSTAVRLGLLVLSAAVLCLVLLFAGGRRCGTLRSQMVGADALHALCEGKTETPDLVDRISFDGWDLFRAGDTWYWSIPEGQTQPYAPKIALQGKGTLDIAFLQTETDDAFLSAGSGLPFVIYSNDRFCRGTLQITTLPLVSLTVTQPGISDIDSFDDVRISAMFFDNRACASNRRLVTSDAMARMRGSSSSTLPKKSFRLSLLEVSPGKNDRKRDLSVFGLRSDDDWILYSAAGDPERLRNAFCNDLWTAECAANNTFGVEAGIHGVWTEVLVNGEYRGVYWLTYPLDSKQLGLDSNDFYYRGENYNETTVEMLRAASGTETVIGGWEFRGPNDSTAVGADRWAELSGYLGALWGTYDELQAWVDDYVYLPNMIDYYLFVDLINGKDNSIKNLNLIFYEGKDTVCLFAPWDMDLTWGSRYDPALDWHIEAYAIAADAPYLARSLLLPRLRLLREEVNAQFIARWWELRAGVWSDASLNAMLDTYEAQLFASGAMAREHERWQTAPLAENLDTFRAYVLARAAFIDQTIEEVGMS